MILIVCTECLLALRVLAGVGEPGEVDYLVGEKSQDWPKATCTRCDSPAQRMREVDVEPKAFEKLEVIDLSPKEAFMALNGLGLPPEQHCTFETIARLLREVPIRRVHGVDVPGTERCMLDHFELMDGTRMYLGASSHGAVVYRVAPPFSYAKAVDHAE